MQVNRLNKLADFLDALPRKAFDLRVWAGKKGRTAACYPNAEFDGDFNVVVNRAGMMKAMTPESALSCGTVACAVGWATTIPSFRKSGFRMVKEYDCGEVLIPTFKGSGGWNAVESFFGLDWTDAREIFSASSYNVMNTPTPKQVAKRIRELTATAAT